MNIKYNEWINKKARISLENGRYYKGLILDADEKFVKVKDFKDNIVLIRWTEITMIEGWKG